MHTTPLTLITIVSEAILKDRLVEEFTRLGAKRHTSTDCEGMGSQHRRAGEVLGANVKLEFIVSPELANEMLKALAEEYFPRYAVIAYISSIAVVRGEKYV